MIISGKDKDLFYDRQKKAAPTLLSECHIFKNIRVYYFITLLVVVLPSL